MFGFSFLTRLVHTLLSVVQAPNLSPPNSTHPPSSPSHDDIASRSQHTLCDTILPHSPRAFASIIHSMPMIPMLTNAFSVDYSPWRMERAHTFGSIILGGCNGELRVVSLHNHRKTHTLRGHEHNAIAAICVGQSCHTVSCDSTGNFIFWSDENPTHWYHIPGTGRDECVECMQLVSSHRAVVGTTSGILLLIDLSNGGILSAVRAHAKTVRSLVVAADGSVVVSASADCCARVWNAHTLQPVGNALVGHTKPLNDLAVSECGRRVASAADDGSVCIWDLQTCTQVFAPLRGHHGSALSVTFSADGKLLYSGDSERICMWDVSRLDNEVIFIGEMRDERMRNVCSLRMSADGSELIALASDVFVWRACRWSGGGGGEVARYEWMVA